MKYYLYANRFILKSLIPLDAFLLLTATIYCLFAPVSLDISVDEEGVYLALGVIGIAFCESLALLKHLSVLTFATRIPIRYDTFFVAFMLLVSLPLIFAFAVIIPFLLATGSLFPIQVNMIGEKLRIVQSLTILTVIKLMSIHLLIVIRSGIAWTAVYITLILALLYLIATLESLISMSHMFYTAVFIFLMALIIVVAVKKGFCRNFAMRN